ncbi:MAG: sterol desaturase family protein, partial [Gammaproteobacteria bacterium]|nr:sterol desaturase family protein [Gammaproteobacteria bacterium]
MKMFIIFGVIATFFMIAERIWGARPQPFFRAGFVTDCLYVVTNIGLRFLFTILIASGVQDFGQRYLPEYTMGVLLDQPLWIQAISIIVVLDFLFYWMHRAKHRWQWWWRLHETHHSSQEMDWFSSVRFHP